MIKNIGIILWTILIALIHSQELFKFARVSQERGASCLDGSAPGYYISIGSEEHKNHYLIYFKGGGYCG